MGIKLGLTLREKQRLRVFGNKALKRIFGCKKNDITGDGENYIIRLVHRLFNKCRDCIALYEMHKCS
jgi:hypothetical protein